MFFLFIIYVFLETLLTVQLSGMMGGFYTFIEIVVSVIIGITLLKNMHVNLYESLGALQKKEINASEFQRLTIFSVIGAFLIILPGFLSDIIGLFLQLDAFSLMVMRKMSGAKSPNENEKMATNDPFDKIQTKRKDSEIIDVEVIDSSSKH